MDESELDDWFQGEKEKIDELFQKDLMANIGNPRKIKERYDKSYKNLIHMFQKKQLFMYRNEERSKKLHKPIEQWNEILKNTNIRLINFYKNSKLAVQKRAFDIKFKLTFYR